MVPLNRTLIVGSAGIALGVVLGAIGALVVMEMVTPPRSSSSSTLPVEERSRALVESPNRDLQAVRRLREGTAEAPAAVAGRLEQVQLSVAAPEEVPEGGATSPGMDTGIRLSPSVYATAFYAFDPIAPEDFDVFAPAASERPEVTLVALVLWRGAPGWFLRSEAEAETPFQAGSLDQPGGGWETVARVGPVGGEVLELNWNAMTRVMRLQGMNVFLGDDNVILVDGAGSAAGMQVVGTYRVAETRFRIGDYAALVRQSDELRDYLRCELPLPDAAPADAAEQYVVDVLRGHFRRMCEG